MRDLQYLYKCPKHNTNLNDMRLKGELCDVVIKVTKKSFYAHKVVLAAGFGYFHAMFSHSFQEKDQSSISMKNIHDTNMEALISFAYTGEILITENNALSLLEDTNYLNEVGIKEACIKFLETHLSAEKAGRAWQFARAIECISLENVARKKIMSHFEVFSQTDDYLKLDLESLKIILSDDELHSVQFGKILFEGIMRWILMYDAENRRIFLGELLDFINPINVKADFILDYLCKIVVDQDYEYIEKGIMSFYRSKANQKIGLRTQRSGWILIVANRRGKNIEVQFYDFFKRKWFEVCQIPNETEYFEAISIILNNQLYFIKYAPGGANSSYTHESIQIDAQLEVIDFNTKESERILQRIPRLCAVCASTTHLYLCGGFKTPDTGNNVYSNEIHAYNPEIHLLEALTPMKFDRFYAASIFHQEQLYVLGGCTQGETGIQGGTNLVEKYNLDTKEWSELAPMCEKRWSFGVAILNGKLYACGGPDSSSVEVYDPSEESWRTVASMNKKRWDFVVVALEGKLLAIGGDNEATVEVYYPETDEWLLDRELSSGLRLHKPTGGLIQSSCIFNKK